MNTYTVTYEAERAFPWQAYLTTEIAAATAKREETGYAPYVGAFTMAYTRIGLRFAIRNEEFHEKHGNASSFVEMIVKAGEN